MNQTSSQLLKIAQEIKLLVLDVDGVLTTGDLWFTAQGEEMKVFNAQDGLGMNALLHNGIEVAIISGRKTQIVSKRMEELGVKYVYQGIVDKLPILSELVNQLNLSYAQVAYVGDDVPDIAPLKAVGLAVTVPNATHKVLNLPCIKLITKSCGGKGAVREVCDLLLERTFYV